MDESGVLRRTVLKASAVGLGPVGLAGCMDATASQEPEALSTDEDESQDALMPELDLDTLEAETEYGTLHAELVENSYVGLVGDGRAIGVTFLDEVGAEDLHELDDGIVVQLYNRENLAIALGEVEYAGAVTLETEGRSAFEATVEFVMEEDFVTGTVTFDDEDSTPFTAYAAVGVGGVYWADGTDEESEISCDWVILPDGRQWGCVCLPPFVSPCCEMRF